MEPTNVYSTCESRTGYLAGDYGFIPDWCNGTRGLRFVEDANGHKHYFCPAKGHEADVRARIRRNYPEATAPGELTEAWGR